MARVVLAFFLAAVPLARGIRNEDAVSAAMSAEEGPMERSGSERSGPEEAARIEDNDLARRARAAPQAAIMSMLMRNEKAMHRQIQEALGQMERPDQDEAEEEVMDQQDDEKVRFELMTDAEYQRWLWKHKKRSTLNLVEAEAAIARHFDKSATYTHEAAMASLAQLEESSSTDERRDFWRKQREKLQPVSFSFNASNGSSLLAAAGWDTLKPNIAAFACVQVDIHLLAISLPFMYINLGISGKLGYNPHSKCWGWTLEVSIGISGGITLGFGLRLGVGASLIGTWDLQEVPFSETGLDAKDYLLPNKCGAAKNPNISPEGREMCHSGAPFRLVWVGLKRLIARAADRVFPIKRIKKFVRRALNFFKGKSSKPKKPYMEVQAERWQGYKELLQGRQQFAGRVGTHAFQIRCVGFQLDNAKADTPMKGQKAVRCGLEVGRFESQVITPRKDVSLLVYEPISTQLGGQYHVSEKANLGSFAGGQHAEWSNEQAPGFNALVDRSYAKQVRVLGIGDDPNKNRLEGLLNLDQDIFSVIKTGTKEVQVPVGCDRSGTTCAGSVRLSVSRIRRKGKLTVQCVAAQGLPKKDGLWMVDPYCVLQVAPSVVLGASPLFHTTWVQEHRDPWWGEGSTWGVYAPDTSDPRFPNEGPSGIGLQVAVLDAEHGAVKNVFADILDHFQKIDPRKLRATDIVIGQTSFKWSDLLGASGFGSQQEEVMRDFVVPLGGTKGATVHVRVGWLPFDGVEALREEGDRWQDGFEPARLAWAASAIYTAGEQLLGKLPKYAEQVLERLVDHPDTDRDSDSVDCAIETKSLWGTPTQCVLLGTDGSQGARMSRRVDEADPKQSMYQVGAHVPDWVQDDRVMNFAKAQRVAKRRGTAQFWKELAISAANLFVRTVEDIQALFNIYFADEAEWDGDCDSLKPSFELPYERVSGPKKGRAPQYRMQEETPEQLRDAAESRRLQKKGVKIAQPDETPDDEEEAEMTFNPAADYAFAYGHGYKSDNPGKTAVERLRFYTPDPPTRGVLGAYHIYGETAPTLNSPLWCNLAMTYLNRIRDFRQANLQGELDALDAKIERRVGASRDFKQANLTHPAKRAHPKALAEVLEAFDTDKSGDLQAEELTLQFSAACVDSQNCGDRASCERVTLYGALLAIFPRLGLKLKKYSERLKALLDQVGESEDITVVMPAAKEVIEIIRVWLFDLGACEGDSGRAAEAAEHARGGPKAVAARAAMCAAAKPSASLREEKLTVRDRMAKDFDQAFALHTELPIAFQETTIAKQGFLLLGALWEGLPDIRDALPQGVGDDRDEREANMMARLEEHAKKRMTKLSALVDPKGAWHLEFPLTDAVFTLSLTIETALPGFCTPNEALLWFTPSVTGVSHSWQKEEPPMKRCFTAKVHPFNFYVRIASCGVIKDTSRSKLRNLVWPSWNNKDRDTTVTLFLRLFQFDLGGGVTSIFTSMDPSMNVFSANFLTLEAGKVAALPAAASIGLKGLIFGPAIWFAKGMTDGDFLNVGDLLDAGVMGMGKALRQMFRLLRGQALSTPKDPGAIAMADPKNGEEWADNEDPARQPGETFGLGESEEELPDEDEILDEDQRLWVPKQECMSYCGGQSRWDVPVASLEAKPATPFKSLSKLRADQCVSCKYQDDHCDRFSVEEATSFMKGYFCCRGMACDPAPFRPGSALPSCPKVRPEEAPGSTPTPCCNTVCGARGFEGEKMPALRFGDVNFLKADQCAECNWETKDCKPGWAKQGEQDGKKLCCLKHDCGEDAAGKPVKREPVVDLSKVKRWLPNPGCASTGVDPPWVMSGSDASRTGGTACGATEFGPKKYKFNDPNFLKEGGVPNQCAQCIWVTRSQSCTTAKVVLKDGREQKVLSKEYTQNGWKFHLCCARLACKPELGSSLLQEEAGAEAVSEVAVNKTFLGRLDRPAPEALEERAATSTSGLLQLQYVMFLKGTKYTRYYNGALAGQQPVSVKKTWWGWSISVEGWNMLSKPETIADNFLFANVLPVAAVNLEWDLTPEITKLLDDALLSQHTRRVDNCKACISNQWAYCSRKYIDPKYDKNVHEKCQPRTKQAAAECNGIVSFDDYGSPTSPRFITTEEECGKMRWRKANAGYKRQYGVSKAFTDFRGQHHAPANAPDQWGNSMDNYHHEE